jgi:F-type H+-transporting ATPase subunit b
MLIDWFTIVAQAINFLILVWLLKRFLYKPILDAIDERERRIATQLADAAAKKAEAEKEREDFRQKNAGFDGERAALLKHATEEAQVVRQRLLEEARRDSDELRAKQQDSLQKEQLNLGKEIVSWTQKQVFAITRKTLTDLAGASLEERVCNVFLDRLRELNGTPKTRLAAALKGSAEPVLVRSAFDLPAAQRNAIEQAVKETFAADVRFRFETAADVVSGIELSANGQKVAWSIADYLLTLERNAAEVLHQEAKPVRTSVPINGHEAVMRRAVYEQPAQ